MMRRPGVFRVTVHRHWHGAQASLRVISGHGRDTGSARNRMRPQGVPGQSCHGAATDTAPCILRVGDSCQGLTGSELRGF